MWSDKAAQRKPRALWVECNAVPTEFHRGAEVLPLHRFVGLLFKATFTRNRSYFTNLLIEDILGQLLFSGLKSTIDYAVNKLALRWRSVLNNDLETDYFSNMASVARPPWHVSV